MTLTEFLLARIAEDEEAARHSIAGDIDHLPSIACQCGRRIHLGVTHPARVLAECEAKRRLVELRYSWNLQAERTPEPPFGPILQAQVVTADTALRILAAVYANHPDYDAAAAPTAGDQQ